MIIYNVTSSVDKSISEDWIIWMKDKHIPGLLKTGLFVDYRMVKILNHDDEHTYSFAVQYFAKSMKDVEEYVKTHAPALRDDVQKRYGDKVVSYRTLLEEV
ncbi:MAG TPA: DUF4286 family protein [Cyclobacteriaceae bacterium]|nr:DUF4286 family protein [Cyclobacteriaceae bacterium]